MKIKPILYYSSKISIPEQNHDDIGNLPEWNLSDLYCSPSAKQIELDLEQVKKLSDSFTKKYQNKLSRLSAPEMLLCLQRKEKIASVSDIYSP